MFSAGGVQYFCNLATGRPHQRFTSGIELRPSTSKMEPSRGGGEVTAHWGSHQSFKTRPNSPQWSLRSRNDGGPWRIAVLILTFSALLWAAAGCGPTPASTQHPNGNSRTKILCLCEATLALLGCRVDGGQMFQRAQTKQLFRTLAYLSIGYWYCGSGGASGKLGGSQRSDGGR